MTKASGPSQPLPTCACDSLSLPLDSSQKEGFQSLRHTLSMPYCHLKPHRDPFPFHLFPPQTHPIPWLQVQDTFSHLMRFRESNHQSVRRLTSQVLFSRFTDCSESGVRGPPLSDPLIAAPAPFPPPNQRHSSPQPKGTLPRTFTSIPTPLIRLIRYNTIKYDTIRCETLRNETIEYLATAYPQNHHPTGLLQLTLLLYCPSEKKEGLRTIRR